MVIIEDVHRVEPPNGNPVARRLVSGIPPRVEIVELLQRILPRNWVNRRVSGTGSGRNCCYDRRCHRGCWRWRWRGGWRRRWRGGAAAAAAAATALQNH